MAAPANGSFADLPEPVRARVVALAADALPDVPKLPASVRRVATFAPTRRAKLGGTAIVDALTDDDFRSRVGTQLGAKSPAATDPATEAALAWLTRPDGWEDAVDEAVRRVAERPAPDDRAEREVERLRQRLADAEQAVRDLKAAQRAQVEELKGENATLRRKLGDTRVAEREAREAAQRAGADLARAEADAAERSGALEKEGRRLRAQLERAESHAAQGRRDARSDRDDATLRARVLLETVIDAANGLRRELALPSVSGSPGDRIEAGLESGPTSAGGSSAPASPMLLEQLLSMPRARLLVDGYNVSKAAWPDSSLEAQRIRLVGALAPLVARTAAETTVVFDAAETDHRPSVAAPRGVRVLFSPRGVIADDVLRDLVAAEPSGRMVIVITADQALARDVAGDGARVVGPDVLLDLLAR